VQAVSQAKIVRHVKSTALNAQVHVVIALHFQLFLIAAFAAVNGKNLFRCLSKENLKKLDM
jgi:hypothetical protein